MNTSPLQPAAFIRIEDLLVRDAWMKNFQSFVWLNRQTLPENIFYGMQTLLSMPFSSFYQKRNPVKSQKIRYANFHGMTQDRLSVLGQSFAETKLKKHLQKDAIDWIKNISSTHQVIFFSDQLCEVIEPILGLANLSGHIISNHIQHSQGLLNGALQNPIVGGEQTVSAIGQFSRAHNIALHESLIFSARKQDAQLFTLFKEATAINPDGDFAALCRQMNWQAKEIYI
ncbi:MAG: hypothetical protein KDD52_01110 [Bdellovibrionales bacterium]|nr:hypothetical protein [Bdellovibrionales bacterium]